MANDRQPQSSLHPDYTIDFDAIPTDLTQRKQWVLWREEIRNGKPTKVPYQGDGKTEAKSNDPTTWSTFDDVKTTYDPKRDSGIGFVFSKDDPFFGVDLDSCIKVDGELMPWADDVRRYLPTYAEVSPSGTGLKLIGIGSLPTSQTGKTFTKGLEPADPKKRPEIAMWQHGRYFAITGNAWGTSTIYQCPRLPELWGQLFPAKKADQPKPSNGNLERSSASNNTDRVRLAVAAMCRMDMVDGNDGSRRLYAAACRAVGWDLADHDAVTAIQQYGAIHPFPKHWSGVDILQRIRDAETEAERGADLREYHNWQKQKVASECPQPEAWSEPRTVVRPSVPVFPVDVLPDPLRSWVTAMAGACQVPLDLPAMLGLAACAGACARRVEVIAGRGWLEPINLYVACLLDPGNRKSAVFRSAIAPLRAIERELIEEAGPTIARLQADRRMKEAEQKEAEKKGAKGCSESAHRAWELAEELAVEPMPAMPKLLVDDATAEAIEMHLVSQGGRLIVAGCEGGLFDVMAGRYSKDAGNLDCFLKGHAGDDLRVDRVIRGSVAVDRCCLTLAYAVQPEVIRGMAQRPSFRGRGLIGRFLYAIPETTLGRRKINPEPVSPTIAAAYESVVRRLAAIPEHDEPNLIGLSQDAQTLFDAWQAEVEKWLADDGRLSELRDWGGKLCGLTARLAAIMHLISQDRSEPWQMPISGPIMQSAIDIGRWATDHSEAVIAMMTGVSGPVDDAIYLQRWISDLGKREFSKRDAHQHGRSRFDSRLDALNCALETLIDHGIIRALPSEQSGNRGRPASPKFEINPKFRIAENPTQNTQKTASDRSLGISEYFEDASLQNENRVQGVI
ncbi:MAG: DUF3987 domain-containing protein [bacterium]|nr:DUF3987 domain-containing protein [bacterium]